VGQVFRRYLSTGELDLPRAKLALERLAALPLQRYAHGPLLGRALELRQNATVYDALYLTLAEVLQVPLLTRDTSLMAIPGHTATVMTV
jgi:predicted nucleic acid-binding protein